jgi:hypothetical protein
MFYKKNSKKCVNTLIKINALTKNIQNKLLKFENFIEILNYDNVNEIKIKLITIFNEIIKSQNHINWDFEYFLNNN